jgi:effector-binding domain-containing protein
MIKIGDFSRICQLPVKTLRYYDEVGLLKPVEVDRFTGYRYYGYEQLPRLYRILALKDLGFSLEQIGQLLSEGLPAAELRGMLRLKQAQLREHIQDETERLKRVEMRLKQIEQEANMPEYDIVIKKVDPILVAGLRDTIPTFPEQGELWERLESYLQQHQAPINGPCLTVYYSDEPDVDTEVCEPLAHPIEAGGPVQIHELPAVQSMASVVHHGPFTTIGEAYGAILKWIELQGYQIVGPSREIYLNPPAEEGSQVDSGTVTEIQFPVQKVQP